MPQGRPVTVIWLTQLALLPRASVAVTVTGTTLPNCRQLTLPIDVCKEGVPQASLAVASDEAVSGCIDCPLITTVCGLQVMVGGVTSVSWTLKPQLAVFPKASVTVNVTDCGLPDDNMLPANGCCTMVLVPHPGVRLAIEV